jgi:hypothetical protein
VLNHVRAEEITVSQSAERRDESQQKYDERGCEIERLASSAEDEPVTH